MVKYIKWQIIFCFLFTGCDYVKFAQGVRNDFILSFKKHKQYIVSLPLNGEIIEKNKCIDCNINKFRIKIKLINFNIDTVNIGFRSYEPFYTMEDQSIILSVNKQIYDQIEVNTEIFKKANSNYLIINKLAYRILSDDENKWIY